MSASHHSNDSFDRTTSHMNDEIEELKKRMKPVNDSIIHRKDGFEVDLDIEGYEPEDVKITVQGNILSITGSHEVRSADGSTFTSRNFSRTYTIPEYAVKEQIKSILLSDKRTLKIEAPSRHMLLLNSSANDKLRT